MFKWLFSKPEPTGSQSFRAINSADCLNGVEAQLLKKGLTADDIFAVWQVVLWRIKPKHQSVKLSIDSTANPDVDVIALKHWFAEKIKGYEPVIKLKSQDECCLSLCDGCLISRTDACARWGLTEKTEIHLKT